MLEALKNPVGEAQAEPNRDPHLEKPKIGRGVSDFLKGGIFDISLWNFCGMIWMKRFLFAALSLLITIVLFWKPGILVK